MRVLNQKELENFAEWLRSILFGAQLQKVWTDGEVLVLECYLNRSIWLCIDLNPLSPGVVLLRSKPPIKKNPKPVSLFLSAHGENLRFQKISVDSTKGRVFQARLEAGDRVCEIEVWLIPKHVNLFVRAKCEGEKEKKMSWVKPHDLPDRTTSGEELNHVTDWFSEGDLWLAEKSGAREAVPVAVNSAKSPFEKELTRSIQKKEKAMTQILAQLEAGGEDRYRELGEILKYSKQVPEKFQDLYDSKLSVAENRERAFKKAKDLIRKKEGARARIEILKTEISKLKEKLAKGSAAGEKLAPTEQKKSLANKILQSSESKARKRVFDSGFEAVMGKSAHDNLSILREARAWDYWLHLRDYPGAHAIIFRNKGQAVPDSIFIQVAQWVVDETISKKQISSGVKYDVIVAECRFVKPVKGSPGLVTYQNTRTFTFASK